MATRLVFTVDGTPAPQGSKTRMPNGAMVESSPRLVPWREAVRHEGELAAQRHGWTAPLGPMAASLVFTLRRPKAWHRADGTLKPGAPTHPTARPDLDKLIRSTLDGLTDSGAITDDSQVAVVHAVKCYPGGDLDALDHPGVVIVLEAVDQ